MGKENEPNKPTPARCACFLEFYDKTPDLISEPELQEYFLQRKNVNHWSPKTMRICYCGIRFFYVNVLERDWHILSILRAQNEHRLPAVLSVEEVRSILAHVKTFHNHAYLSTVYSCGLRLHEGLHLEVSDIDSSAHDDPCPPRQGRQGPLCPAASVDSSFAAPILAHSPPSPPSLPGPWPKRNRRQRGPESHGQK